ncbi:lytic polysaccharide monooxygenase, partial [Streptomyces sp. CFMR 7]|uniref:lytic polysaccharide monooxygenase n=1 Tax=Streptomyces sp. CFMR 7 TaxID=1649184 RepID=UPI0011A23619
TGRHIVYKVWQRHDSPEAFYGCSDVAFGTATPTAAKAKAPTETKIDAGTAHSTVSHHGHGGDEQPPALLSATSQPTGTPLSGNVAWAASATLFAVSALFFGLGRRRTSRRPG